MKLFFAPYTCSLGSHIVLRELNLPFEPVKVDLGSKRTEAGDDYTAINPKGYVAAIQLDNGEVLTEGVAIMQYLADLEPQAQLAPPPGSWERSRLQEWLNFITTELHATFSPMFNKAMPAAAVAIFKAKLSKRLEHVEAALSKRDYLLGDRFSVADAYLFTVLRWTRFFDMELAAWPATARYMESIAARRAVKAAIEFEEAPLPA
jgi:glutathione S-transferase